jgi:hypothetical protein
MFALIIQDFFRQKHHDLLRQNAFASRFQTSGPLKVLKFTILLRQVERTTVF